MSFDSYIDDLSRYYREPEDELPRQEVFQHHDESSLPSHEESDDEWPRQEVFRQYAELWGSDPEDYIDEFPREIIRSSGPEKCRYTGRPIEQPYESDQID